MTESSATQELVITRIFDAPRELVYKAFIDPDQLAQWFGPVGYSIPRDTVEIDARVGGHQRLVMVNDNDPSWRAPVNKPGRTDAGRKQASAPSDRPTPLRHADETAEKLASRR